METNYHVGVWRFPKIEGTILGGKEVFWAVYWGPPPFVEIANKVLTGYFVSRVSRTFPTITFT